MTDTENAILAALNELDAAVKRMAATEPKPDLVPLFVRLDELARRLPPDADSELVHFLRRKSYQKARLLLLGRGGESNRGACH